MTTRYKIIIVGGGPAGLSTALHLAKQSPELAAETLILEAKQHPRPKLCGGGVTVHGEEQLRHLGITVDVPAFTAHRLVFQLGSRNFDVPHRNALRVYERAEFDSVLANAAKKSGVQFHTNERLLDIQSNATGVDITTNKATYHATVVVAADGANSTVRRKLRLVSTLGVARLLRVLTPVDPQQTPLWNQETAIFDFSCVQHGIQGYMWDFPCLVNGQPCMNRGIFDSRIDPPLSKMRQTSSLKAFFLNALQDRKVDPEQITLQGHPVRWFNPLAEFSRPHILLAGDAAGVDPLFAEGISYGMEYGIVVTQAIQDAFATNEFAFHDYRDRLMDHRLGKLLQRRTVVAGLLYRHRIPPLWSLIWQLADIAPKKLQQRFAASLALLPAS